MRYVYHLFTWIVGGMHIKAITRSQSRVDRLGGNINFIAAKFELNDGQLMRWARDADGKLSNSTITISGD